jgi:uncharacterized protein YijF (DUF1287 family)
MISRRLFVTGMATGAVVAGGAALWPSRGSGQVVAAEPWARKLVTAAEAQIGVTLVYDPSYRRIDYPGGDVPRVTGVCTDVVVRAYRDGLGLDLQKLVHDDMKRAFSSYPKLWGLASTDTNIDHRRVPNLRTFFERRGAGLPISAKGDDYKPGEIVSQILANGRPHIGIVSHRMNDAGTAPLLIHNIGLGARAEDVLFALEITGRYRFAG